MKKGILPLVIMLLGGSMIIKAQIGINMSTPHAPLQLKNEAANRKIVLYETTNNDHQFYGFGINANLFRYQVDFTSSDHVFYAGTSSTTSNELMRIKGTGNVGINTSNPISRLEVNGASTNTSAYNAGSGKNINFSLSNLAYTTASPGGTPFILTNMKDGGTYTLSVRGTTSGVSTFTASGFIVKYVNNRTTVATKETLYTFIVMGSIIYVYTASGF